MRLLAWLLHGSLSHFVHCQNPHVNCHPVKFEENTHIADYVLIILFSFAEQFKVCFKTLSLKSLMNFRIFSSDCRGVIQSIVRDLFCVLIVRFTACRGCCVLFLSDSWTRNLTLSFMVHKEYQLLLMNCDVNLTKRKGATSDGPASHQVKLRWMRVQYRLFQSRIPPPFLPQSRNPAPLTMFITAWLES